MAVFATHNPFVFAFGILGNIASFVVFLAPVPTFVRIYKKKSTEGFQSFPYAVALFSAMIWLYYAWLKSDAFLLITINSAGCFIETIYITLFMAYAPKQARVPNVLGFLFGVVQMILYVIYKNLKTVVEEPKLPETNKDNEILSTCGVEEAVSSELNGHENGENMKEQQEEYNGNKDMGGSNGDQLIGCQV